jgi:hypothetical protein
MNLEDLIMRAIQGARDDQDFLGDEQGEILGDLADMLASYNINTVEDLQWVLNRGIELYHLVKDLCESSDDGAFIHDSLVGYGTDILDEIDQHDAGDFHNGDPE